MQRPSQDYEFEHVPQEFSFEDFFHGGSGQCSPVGELHNFDLATNKWKGPCLLKAGDISKKEAEKLAREGQFLGKRDIDTLEDTPNASTTYAEYLVDDLSLEDRPRQIALIKVLAKCLVHQCIEAADLELLDSMDLAILRSIVKRKYRSNFPDCDDKKKLILELNSLDSRQTGAKRSEENNKLVFKRAIKYLISWYKKNRWQDLKDLRKKQYETMICQEFFSELPMPDNPDNEIPFSTKSRLIKKNSNISTSIESSLCTGVTETTKERDEIVRKFVITPKTINARYIRFVFQSTAFKEFFDDFVANHFIADYRKNRPNKVRKIIDAVYVNFHSKKTRPTQLQNAKDYIEKNPKFKMPWSDKELETCVKSTKEFIGRVFRVRDDKRKRR
jgi:hypothetical protein